MVLFKKDWRRENNNLRIKSNVSMLSIFLRLFLREYLQKVKYLIKINKIYEGYQSQYLVNPLINKEYLLS